MKYKSGLAKKERENIFELFLKESKLKFSDIEKAIKIRSNMVSYHIEMMQKEGILEKKGNFYSLTKTAERYVPVFQHLLGLETSPLPVVLIALTNKNKILMIKRTKRPYKNYWSLIGGKILFEESIEDSTSRLIKEKAGITCTFETVNCVAQEKVMEENVVKHSFFLFFVKAKTKDVKTKSSENGELKWFDLNKLDKKNIIPSDYWLIQNKLNSKLKIKNILMNEKNDKISSFKIY